MRIIDETTIEVNRGDELRFNYQIFNGKTAYKFQKDDCVGFYVYKANGLNKTCLIEKIFYPEIDEVSLDIVVPAEDMEIGDVTNIPQDYWYEITLNGEITLGYDADGAKILKVYPQGVK